MIYHLKILLSGIKVAFAASMAYRGDFLLKIMVMLTADLLMPLITLMIYRNGAVFPGWTLYEVLLIQGVFMLAKGVAFPFFFGMVWHILDRVREGTFDLLLIKPCSTLYLSIAESFDTDQGGTLLGGLAIFLYAVFHIKPVGLLIWLQFLLLFFLSVSVFFSFSLFMSGMLFKWVGNSRVYEIFDALSIFGLFPKTIYAKSFQNIISYLIPIAMMSFFPASALLGKTPPELAFSLVTTIAFLFFSIFFWHKMLKNYSSAGG